MKGLKGHVSLLMVAESDTIKPQVTDVTDFYEVKIAIQLG